MYTRPSMHAEMNAYGGPRQRSRAIAIGIALSLALHALLLFAYRHKAPPVDQRPDTRPMSVWLRLAPPVQPPAKPPTQPELKKEPGPPPRHAPQRPRPAAVSTITIDDNASATPAAPAAAATSTATTPAATPRFDADAARKAARELADVPDPARAGMAVAQIPAAPLATETRAARAIGSAHRRNCKDGVPGGLLAPLLLLMDKKDSGCKW